MALEDEGSNYEQVKQETRDKFHGIKAIDLVRSMHMAQNHKEQVEEELKRINAEFDVLRLELIPAAMEQEGISSPFNVSGIGRVTLTGDAYVRTVNKEGLFTWLQSHGLEDIITESVNSSTLKAFAKDRLKKGLDLPDAIQVTPFTRASITRS